MKSGSFRRALPWSLTVISLVAVLVLAALLVLPKIGAFGLSNLLGSAPDGRDRQIIASITKEEQVALLSLAIQGISEANDKTTLPLLGAALPGSERAIFVQYEFTAKLGIDGKEVTVDKIGENAFLVSIPEFILIGHGDVDLKVAAEDSGALSWLTPEVDQLAMANDILSDDAQEEYISKHRDLLEDQAEDFYSSIITGVDPSADVEFEFSQ